MKERDYIQIVVIVLIFLSGCNDLYQPSFKKSTTYLLVVDGFINLTDSAVIVKLSRAIPVDDKNKPPVEKGAIVSMEDDAGNNYTLMEKKDGDYELKAFFNAANKYRLHIQTTDNKKYESELIDLKQSPPIDSVVWRPEKDGTSIHVNTHDPTRKTRYYLWNYTETWIFHSKYYSSVIFQGNSIVPRPSDQQIYSCWGGGPSSSILINSTIQLSNDVVDNFQLLSIDAGSIKLAKRYSILVEQRALSPEGYNYYTELKKSTESLGGLFDPLPIQVEGNMHNTADSSEPVLGFFCGGTVERQRIFIDFYDLPHYLQQYPLFAPCEIDSIPANEILEHKTSILISSYGAGPAGYTTASDDCIDCRLQGGVTEKPAFWK